MESSTFGSEFVTMRIAKDLAIALRYKLRMFGIPIDGPADVFCDNQGVVKNMSLPESMLSKKHNAINYHAVRGDFIGYQEIACHWAFDIMMDLTRKARLLAGGDMTGLPSSSAYSSMVTRESVCIAFLIAGLNDLDVLVCDIKNAYLNAPC